MPIYDQSLLFKFLIFEGAQAGLCWFTIVNQRKAYQEAFDNFDVIRVASYDTHKMHELLANSVVVRNKLKIKAAVNRFGAAGIWTF